MQSPFLVVDNVSKSFGSTRALQEVSLAIQQGEVFGLAGENGAGKSTLIKVLCGVHQPDSGRIPAAASSAGRGAAPAPRTAEGRAPATLRACITRDKGLSNREL